MTEETKRDEEENTILEDISSEENEQVASPTEDEIPEKYRGKSTKELVQILQEKEKFTGKQSQEVGELRKIVDTYIEQQSAQLEKAPVEEEFDDTDFFANPKEAIARAVKNHPSVRQAEQVSQSYTQQTALAQIKAAHPDVESIIADPEFANWIKGSPVKTELWYKADQQFDTAAAHELFTDWKRLKQVNTQTEEVEKVARKQAAQAANVGGGRGSSESAGLPVYRRSDIVNMMVERPAEYQRRIAEFRQAYQDGRVRSI